MNLLLFLSAILSALTGVISGGRVADVQVERSYGSAGQAQQGAIVRLAPVRVARHWLTLAGRWASPTAGIPSVAPVALRFASAPLYLDRLRE